MPALITHDFFGRDVYDRLYTFIGGSRDEADAFLLGNQGPDPLFYLVLSPQSVSYTHLAEHGDEADDPEQDDVGVRHLEFLLALLGLVV